MKFSLFLVALVSQLVSSSPIPIPIPTLEETIETAAKSAANAMVRKPTDVAAVKPFLGKSRSFSNLEGSMSSNPSRPMPIAGAVSAQQEASAAAASASAGMSSSAPPHHSGWLDSFLGPVVGYLDDAKEASIKANAWDPAVKHLRSHI